MLKLTKVEHDIFSEYYEGNNGDKKVTCILDEICIRYIVLVPSKYGVKVSSRREYSNGNEKRCFAAAEKALNKQPKRVTGPSLGTAPPGLMMAGQKKRT